PGSRDLLVTGRAPLRELREHEVPLVGWDAGPGIGDLDHRVAVLTPHGDADRLAGGRELRGVVHQLANDLGDPSAVDPRGDVRLGLDLDGTTRSDASGALTDCCAQVVGTHR